MREPSANPYSPKPSREPSLQLPSRLRVCAASVFSIFESRRILSPHFVFAAGDGDDFVRDFTLTGANHDFLVFHGVLESSISVVQDGNDAVVTYDGGDTILLRNVDAAALTSEYFLFA